MSHEYHVEIVDCRNTQSGSCLDHEVGPVLIFDLAVIGQGSDDGDPQQERVVHMPIGALEARKNILEREPHDIQLAHLVGRGIQDLGDVWVIFQSAQRTVPQPGQVAMHLDKHHVNVELGNGGIFLQSRGGVFIVKEGYGQDAEDLGTRVSSEKPDAGLDMFGEHLHCDDDVGEGVGDHGHGPRSRLQQLDLGVDLLHEFGLTQLGGDHDRGK